MRIPQDSHSLQEAIDNSERGDTIEVAPGTYYENIVLRDGRNLIGAGAQKTILTDDGDGAPDPIVQIDGDCLLKGFTITGARGAGIGHAVMIGRGSPKITDNIIRDNSYTGIGVHASTVLTSPLITGNAIYGNGGAGIANLGQFCKTKIVDNDIYSNTNAGVACTDSANPTIEKNRLYSNGVGVASKDEARAVIKDNVIFKNKLVGIPVIKNGKAIIVNNLIFQNETVGINLDGEGEAWIVNNDVKENGTVAITVKSKSKAYIAFNQLRSETTAGLQVRDSEVTALKNNITCELNFDVTDSPAQTNEKGETLKDVSFSGPGALSVKNSKYLAGGNKIHGKVEIDDVSKVEQIPDNELPSSAEEITFPEFDNPETAETVAHPASENPLPEAPTPAKEIPVKKIKEELPPSTGCLGLF
ncbi:MAG: right-handed parallel beta-helix repeat-containing protein [Candidatus Schekmanbacteria bacterium]|nr:right-handed parallel beta-helix repeat-containing protein [Candidatus Schekmanbacteria bacterium]